MSADLDLERAFVAALSPEAAKRAEAIPARRARLEGLYDGGRSRWPTVALSPTAFGRRLAEAVAGESDLAGALDALDAADLYLASACAAGEPRALQLFEQRYRQSTRDVLAQQLPPDVVDEALQRLFERLLVATSDAAPRIGQYMGRGPLSRWLRVSATRAALNVMRGEKRRPDSTPAGDAALASLAESDADPETVFVRRHYGEVFRQAIEAAIQRISDRDRALLKLHLADRLTLEQIAPIYQVHVATISRWLTKARQGLLDSVRELLLERLEVDASGYRSILRVVDGELDVTLSRLLRQGTPGSDPTAG